MGGQAQLVRRCAMYWLLASLMLVLCVHHPYRQPYRSSIQSCVVSRHAIFEHNMQLSRVPGESVYGLNDKKCFTTTLGAYSSFLGFSRGLFFPPSRLPVQKKMFTLTRRTSSTRPASFHGLLSSRSSARLNNFHFPRRTFFSRTKPESDFTYSFVDEIGNNLDIAWMLPTLAPTLKKFC